MVKPGCKRLCEPISSIILTFNKFQLNPIRTADGESIWRFKGAPQRPLEWNRNIRLRAIVHTDDQHHHNKFQLNRINTVSCESIWIFQEARPLGGNKKSGPERLCGLTSTKFQLNRTRTSGFGSKNVKVDRRTDGHVNHFIRSSGDVQIIINAQRILGRRIAVRLLLSDWTCNYYLVYWWDSTPKSDWHKSKLCSSHHLCS